MKGLVTNLDKKQVQVVGFVCILKTWYSCCSKQNKVNFQFNLVFADVKSSLYTFLNAFVESGNICTLKVVKQDNDLHISNILNRKLKTRHYKKIDFKTDLTKQLTCKLSVGSFCLKLISQISRVPSILVVKKTAGRTGLQQPSVR